MPTPRSHIPLPTTPGLGTRVTVPHPPAAPITTPGMVPIYNAKQAIRREQFINIGDTAEGRAFRACYGTVRFSPLIAHVSIPSGSSTMHLVFHLGEGEIDSITSVYYGSTLVYDGSTAKAAWCMVAARLGTLAQTEIAEVPETDWSSVHPGHALLYLGVNLSSAEISGGTPDVEVILKGRKLYDPRTATTAWSENPILIAYDLLTNTEFGAGIDTAALDFASSTSSWWAAADRCDETVNSQARWRAGFVLTDRQPVMDVVRNLLQDTCAGFLYWADGLWRVGLDEQRVVGCRPATGTTAVGTTDRAQSFMAPGPRIKPTIKLDLAVGFTNPTLRLRSTLAGADLATATVTGLSAGTGQEVNFDLSAAQLTTGATYYLVLTATTGVTWHQAGSSLYAGGSAWNNSGGWASEAKDFWFQVHFADHEIVDALSCAAGQIPILPNGKQSSLSFSRSREEAPNVVIVTYYDTVSWQQVETRVESSAVKAGTDQSRELRQQFLNVPGADQAYRLARQWYYLSQRTLHAGVTIPQHGIQIAPGDVVSLTSLIGPLAGVWFRVRTVTISVGTFTLELIPYDWTDYSREELASLDTITIPNAESGAKFYSISDDFTTGGTTTGTVGEWGWKLSSGSVTYATLAGHPGIVKLANGVMKLDGTQQQFADKSIWNLRQLVYISSWSSGGYCVIQVCSKFSIYLDYNSGSPVIKVNTVSTGVAVALNDWIDIRGYCDGGSVAYLSIFKNGTLVFSSSAAVSSTTIGQYLGMSTNLCTAGMDLAQLSLGVTR